MEIIGLTGKAGVGKDYLATNYLMDKNTILLAFGDILKQELINNYGLSIEELYINKTQETRFILQIYSNKLCKKSNENYFVDKLENMIKMFNIKGYNKFIITDVRFNNEAEMIKKYNGKIIKIINNNGNIERINNEKWTEEMKNDVSENGILLDYIDYVYYNEKNKFPTELINFIK